MDLSFVLKSNLWLLQDVCQTDRMSHVQVNMAPVVMQLLGPLARFNTSADLFALSIGNPEKPMWHLPNTLPDLGLRVSRRRTPENTVQSTSPQSR